MGYFSNFSVGFDSNNNNLLYDKFFLQPVVASHFLHNFTMSFCEIKHLWLQGKLFLSAFYRHMLLLTAASRQAVYSLKHYHCPSLFYAGGISYMQCLYNFCNVLHFFYTREAITLCNGTVLYQIMHLFYLKQGDVLPPAVSLYDFNWRRGIYTLLQCHHFIIIMNLFDAGFFFLSAMSLLR